MRSAFRHRRFSRAHAVLLLAAPLVVAPLARPAVPLIPVNDDVVSLPPLMVEEKSKPLAWRYIMVDDLELLSVCDDDVTLSFARRYHRLGELLTAILPERFQMQSVVPEVQILFNEETGRARSQEIIADMLKRDATRSAPPPVEQPGMRRTYNQPPPRIRFLPNMRLSDLDATAIFAILQDNAAPSSFTFATDRISALLERRAPALPAWFVAGMMGLYGRVDLRADEIEFKPVEWLSAEETAALIREPERPRTLLPMPELFTHHRPKPSDETAELERVWRAQCALFLRWAIAERKGANREALWKFLDRLQTEPPTEALFREHFGVGYADMRDRLSDYLPSAVQTKLTLDGPKTKPLPRLRLRPATDLEVARIRGRWERMEIPYVRRRYPDVAEKYVEQARRTLHRAYDQGERDPALLAELGLTEVDARNPAAAREFLEGAVAGKIVRPRVYFELALLRYKTLPENANATAKLSPEQVRSIVDPLLAGRVDTPPVLESYALLVDVWTRSPVALSPAELAIAEEGARFFPQASALVFRAIYFNAVAGRTAPAIALAQTGLRFASDPAMRQRFERLLVELQTPKK